MTLANKPVSYAFMFCNNPSAKRQYPRRLKLFFDSIGLEVDLEQQGQAFLENSKQVHNWPSQQIMMYLDHEKQHVLRKEMSAGTLKTLWTQ
jgi:hypothetical protein